MSNLAGKSDVAGFNMNKQPQSVSTTTKAGSTTTSITVDMGKLIQDLDNNLNGDLSILSDEELTDFVIQVTHKLYKIVYNAVDYANKKMDIVSLSALQYISDVRNKKVTYSQQTLQSMDPRATTVYSIITKLDLMDPSMGINLMLAIRQSSR